MAAADFFNFLRFRGTTQAACTSCRSFSKQSSRLRLCSRVRLLERTISPASLIRLANSFAIRSFTWSGRLSLSAKFQCRVALEFTLFTFCPPGPGLREKVNFISLRGILMWSLITSRFDTTATPATSKRDNLRGRGCGHLPPRELANLAHTSVDSAIECGEGIEHQLLAVEHFDFAPHQFYIKRSLVAGFA